MPATARGPQAGPVAAAADCSADRQATLQRLSPGVQPAQGKARRGGARPRQLSLSPSPQSALSGSPPPFPEVTWRGCSRPGVPPPAAAPAHYGPRRGSLKGAPATAGRVAGRGSPEPYSRGEGGWLGSQAYRFLRLARRPEVAPGLYASVSFLLGQRESPPNGPKS